MEATALSLDDLTCGGITAVDGDGRQIARSKREKDAVTLFGHLCAALRRPVSGPRICQTWLR
jgi:hypothetical protein